MAVPSDPIPIAIVGGGWRAALYLRVAEALPERFVVAGMVVRDPVKGSDIEQRWGLPTHRTVGSMLGSHSPTFVVVAVTKSSSSAVLRELAEADAPVLAETPPAPDLEGLRDVCRLADEGARIQVAEQVPLLPMHAARLEVIASGRLGTVSQAQVSSTYGYHAVSLIRRFLGVDHREQLAVEARSFTAPLVVMPDASGSPAAPTEERVVESRQILALLRFPGAVGVYDFAIDQFFSRLRSDRVLIRGELGEINGAEVRYLRDHAPVRTSLDRVDGGHGGSVEGLYHAGVLAAGEWVYRNPFAPIGLSDDEIAVATCLSRMVEFARSGADFYSVQEAAHDTKVSIAIERGAVTGETIHVGPD